MVEEKKLTLESLREAISAKMQELAGQIAKSEDSVISLRGTLEGLQMVQATLNKELNYGEDSGSEQGACTQGACSGECACAGAAGDAEPAAEVSEKSE